MFLGITATIFVLQCLVVYAAARWDYRAVGASSLQRERERSQQALERTCVAVGTLYLMFRMLPAAVYRWEGISGWVAVELGVALAVPLLLAWSPVRHWIMERFSLTARRLLHLVLFYYILNECVGFVGGYLPYSMTGMPTDKLSGPLLYGLLLDQLGMLAIALLAAGLGSKPRWEQVRRRLHLQRRLTLRLVGIAFLAMAVTWFSDALVAGGLTAVLEQFSLGPSPVPSTLSPDAGLGLLLMGTVGAGLAEEFFYRGLLQPRIGIFWTSGLFAVSHGHYPWPALVALFVSSLFIGWVAKRYGLWVVILAHGMHNAGTYATRVSGEAVGSALGMGFFFLGLGVVLWLALRWCYAYYQRRQGTNLPFTPGERPGLASWLGVGFFSLQFCITLYDPAHVWTPLRMVGACVVAGLTYLLCVPRLRAFLLPRLGLAPARWAHLLAFYYLISLVSEALLRALFPSSATLLWSQQGVVEILLGGIFLGMGVALFVFLGIGTGVTRKRPREIFQRLGLAQNPTWRGWLVAPSLAVAITWGGYGLWRGYGALAGLWAGEVAPVQVVWRAHPTALVPIFAAMFLMLFAEELLFRGALQPRLGILRTSFFAMLSGAGLMYAFYGVSPALLVLFLYGLGSLLLGWVAQKYGVWMSMLRSCLVHTCVFLCFFW